MDRQAYIASLREVAELFEKHPDLPVPAYADQYVYTPSDKLPDVARALRKFKKHFSDNSFDLVYSLPGFDLVFSALRSLVCERVQIGTTRRKQQVEEVPATYKTIEVEEPIYMWKCPDALLPETKKEA